MAPQGLPPRTHSLPPPPLQRRSRLSGLLTSGRPAVVASAGHAWRLGWQGLLLSDLQDRQPQQSSEPCDCQLWRAARLWTRQLWAPCRWPKQRQRPWQPPPSLLGAAQQLLQQPARPALGQPSLLGPREARQKHLGQKQRNRKQPLPSPLADAAHVWDRENRHSYAMPSSLARARFRTCE